MLCLIDEFTREALAAREGSSDQPVSPARPWSIQNIFDKETPYVPSQYNYDYTSGNPLAVWSRSASERHSRLNRHSAHPKHGCGEMDEGQEVDGPSVVACGEAPEVLEFVEAALDAIAVAVDRLVVRDDHLAGAV